MSKMSEVRRNNKNSAFFKNIDFRIVAFSSLIIKHTTTHKNKLGTENCSFNLVMFHKANISKRIIRISEQIRKNIGFHHVVVLYQVTRRPRKTM